MTALPPRIDRFEIRSLIGEGGMGTLFLAWDPQLERNVAIKVLRQNDEALRRRFLREARSAARLQHRHIITVYDVGSHEGQPFIAMEYIPGFTLRTVIEERRPVPVERKLRWIEELCDGLGYAHGAGIIHRDIKPANLMIDGSGSVQILDFGIARVLQAGNLTMAGTVLGTLNYMSPEQLSGRDIDHRSDIHAVGAVLYELLTYRQAFPGSMADGVVGLVLQKQPEPLETLVPGLDPRVSAMVERSLRKDPAERYQDLAALRDDLRRWREGQAPTVEHRLGESPTSGAPTAPVPVADSNASVSERGSLDPTSGGPGLASSHPTVVERRVPLQDSGPSGPREDPAGVTASGRPEAPTPAPVAEDPDENPSGSRRWVWAALAASLLILAPASYMLLRGEEPSDPESVEPAALPAGGSQDSAPLTSVDDSTAMESPDSVGGAGDEDAPAEPTEPADSADGRVAPGPTPPECLEIIGKQQLGVELTEAEETFLAEQCRR